METLSKIEVGTFLKLFNRGGYVLDFSTNDFDVFTLGSIGVALCDKYKMSKGKSLTAYLNEASDGDVTVRSVDLSATASAATTASMSLRQCCS